MIVPLLRLPKIGNLKPVAFIDESNREHDLYVAEMRAKK